MTLMASTPVMVSRYLRPLAIVAMLHAGSQPELAYAQSQALREMYRATWTAGDGAPQGITHLAQDRDGSLWVGSESGLFNFDGQTFRLFAAAPGEPKLPVGEVSRFFTGVRSLRPRTFERRSLPMWSPALRRPRTEILINEYDATTCRGRMQQIRAV